VYQSPLLNNGPLLCGFNVSIKGLKTAKAFSSLLMSVLLLLTLMMLIHTYDTYFIANVKLA